MTTIDEALTIKEIVDVLGGDIVLKRLKDEAKEGILKALVTGTIPDEYVPWRRD